MGRGRAKAKQTKVARELKYFSPDTDYDALRQELNGGGARDGEHATRPADPASDDYDDPYDEDPYDDEPVPRH